MQDNIQAIIDKLDNSDPSFKEDITKLSIKDIRTLLDALKGDRNLYRAAVAEVIKQFGGQT